MVKYIFPIVAVLALVIALVAFVSPSVIVEAPRLGAIDDTTFTNGIVLQKGFTQGGTVLNINATTSTYTLTQAELDAASVIEIEAVTSGPQAALALTLPATSTMKTLLPRAGQSRTWIIEDNHTGVATTTTVTAGTGVDLVAYTTADDAIDPGEFAQLTCWRKENTDIGCFTTEMLAAD